VAESTADRTTVASPSRFHADPIKGSRFIAAVVPVADEGAAQAMLADIRAEFSDARHHCWAYDIDAGRLQRSSDDGEPGGSAGRPILAQIQGHGLTDVLVVVVRYFGGVKLGVGGLIRAYGGTAGKALDRAELRVVPVTAVLRVLHGYADTAAVEAALRDVGAKDVQVTYEADIRRRVQVRADRAEALVAALQDATSGRVRAAAVDESTA